MAPTAEDRARALWGIPQGQPVVIRGSGDGKLYQDARHLANSILPKMVNQEHRVKFNSRKELDTFLTQYGFEELVDKARDHNPPGRMIFYRKGYLLIRVKTKGNPPNATYHANRPHLTVSLLNDAASTAFEAEIVKFDPVGRPQPHTLSRGKKGARLLPVNGQGKYAGDEDLWGNKTHLEFDPSINELK